MGQVQFSDIQLVNLSMLITIRDGIQRDTVAACCRFGLHVDQANFLCALTMDQLLVFVANIGEECLFPPRQDLFSLLELPLPLAGLITTVRPQHKATYQEPKVSHAQNNSCLA